MGKITLKTLAERLGVSVSAISLAINGRPGLSDETRDRILNEVEKAGYQVRKDTAPSTRILLLFCRTSVASLLNSSSRTDYIFMDLQRGILDLASQKNCVTTIQYWDIDGPLNFEVLRDCEGILLFNAPLLSPRTIERAIFPAYSRCSGGSRTSGPAGLFRLHRQRWWRDSRFGLAVCVRLPASRFC